MKFVSLIWKPSQYPFGYFLYINNLFSIFSTRISKIVCLWVVFASALNVAKLSIRGTAIPWTKNSACNVSAVGYIFLMLPIPCFKEDSI